MMAITIQKILSGSASTLLTQRYSISEPVEVETDDWVKRFPLLNPLRKGAALLPY